MTTDCWIRGLLRCTGEVHSLGHNVQSVADMNRITRADTITYSTWQTMVSILHHTFLSERSVTLQLPEPAPGVLPEFVTVNMVSALVILFLSATLWMLCPHEWTPPVHLNTCLTQQFVVILVVILFWFGLN